MKRTSIGLALGSGAGRGWAHIGVIKRLIEAGVEFDVIAGTSIGALVGGVHLAGHLDTLESWACSLNRLRILRYLDFGLGRGGMISGRRLTRLLRENLGTIASRDLDKRFIAVATELLTGHEIWLRDGNLVDNLRASFAMPGVFDPINLDGRWLVDGALVNPVPVSVCRAQGVRLVIAVNLNADMIGRGRGPDEAGALNLEDDLFTDLPAARRAGADDPSLFGVMVSSLNILQDRLSRSRMAGDPPDVTIAPRVGHIGLLQFDRAEEAIAEGVAAAERSLPFLSEALTVLGR